MAKRFRGDADNRVDTKGRVSIPAPFRRVLETGDPEWEKGERPQLVIVYGQMDGRKCLECYSVRGMEEVEDVIEDLPLYSDERYAWERILHSQSMDAQLDENGRVSLSAKLRDLIGLEVEKDAKIVGMGNRFQIWEPQAFEEDTKRAMAQHKALIDTSTGDKSLGRGRSRQRLARDE